MRPRKPKLFTSKKKKKEKKKEKRKEKKRKKMTNLVLKERCGKLYAGSKERLRWIDGQGSIQNGTRKTMPCFYHNKLSSGAEI